MLHIHASTRPVAPIRQVSAPIRNLSTYATGSAFQTRVRQCVRNRDQEYICGWRNSYNITAFYNDYNGCQVSQIQDRATLNENFDAKTWGAELEAIWSPARDLRFNANLGYLDTRISRNQYSIDVMNRT